MNYQGKSINKKFSFLVGVWVGVKTLIEGR